MLMFPKYTYITPKVVYIDMNDPFFFQAMFCRVIKVVRGNALDVSILSWQGQIPNKDAIVLTTEGPHHRVTLMSPTINRCHPRRDFRDRADKTQLSLILQYFFREYRENRETPDTDTITIPGVIFYKGVGHSVYNQWALVTTDQYSLDAVFRSIESHWEEKNMRVPVKYGRLYGTLPEEVDPGVIFVTPSKDIQQTWDISFVLGGSLKSMVSLTNKGLITLTEEIRSVWDRFCTEEVLKEVFQKVSERTKVPIVPYVGNVPSPTEV